MCRPRAPEFKKPLTFAVNGFFHGEMPYAAFAHVHFNAPRATGALQNLQRTHPRLADDGKTWTKFQPLEFPRNKVGSDHQPRSASLL